MPFEIKHSAYSGPLDLLLSLIEKRKLFVNDISLSQVTEDYLSHIKNLGGLTEGENHQLFPLHDVSDFIVIASTLILIKSRSLLPELSLSGEEEQSIEDLEDRLKEYQKYKSLSAHIEKLFRLHPLFSKQYIPPSKRKNQTSVFAPAKDISVANLQSGIWRVIESFPKKQVLPKVAVRKVKSLEEVIQDLTKRMTEALTYSFKQFTDGEISKLHGMNKKNDVEDSENTDEKEVVAKEQKVTVIISFLAMLELVKQGMIYANQHNDFGDILMESQQVGTPRY